MSLVDDLLRERTPASFVSPRQPSHGGVGIRRRMMFEDSVKRRVFESRGGITLNEQQLEALKVMLERLDADPFENGGGKGIDTEDLETLGLKADGDQKGSSHGDPFAVDGFEDEGIGLGDDNDDLISPSAAVVAPIATPDHDRDIPEEVLQTMKVLQSDEEEVPLSSLDSQQAPQEPQPQQAQAPADPSQQQQAAPQGASGGGETPAGMADTIRKNFANESAQRQASRVQEQPLPAPTYAPPVYETAPAPAMADPNGNPWGSIMENYRRSHRAAGLDSNVTGHTDGATKAMQKAQLRGKIEALRG